MIAVGNVSKTYGKHAGAGADDADVRTRADDGVDRPERLRQVDAAADHGGVIRPETGRVLFGERELTLENAEALRHAMGYVIQDGGLFPHLTAERT